MGLSPGAWGAPNKGNADGAEGIFGNCRMRVGYGPAPGPTIKKALCHTCPFGGAGNKYRSPAFWPASFFILRSQGAFPPGFYLLWEGWIYRPAPEAPLIRGMPTGRGHFWKLPDACGLRPCTRTHHKKALCHTCPFGGASNKYHSPAFWLGCLAFVPDRWSKPRTDSGSNRPPTSAGQPSGGRAAFSDPFCTPCITLDLTV